MTAKRFEILEAARLMNFSKISQLNSIKSGSLFLRSKNMGMESKFSSAKDKKDLILFIIRKSREKNCSKLAGKSKNVAEDKNSEKSTSNIRLKTVDMIREK